MPADGDLHPIGSGHGFRPVTVDLRIRTGPAHGVHVDGDLHNTGSGPGFCSVTVHISAPVQTPHLACPPTEICTTSDPATFFAP